jgi:hypothetical protein
MLCGHQVPFSETWPTSGMTRGGSLYPLPMPGRRTAAIASSSSPGLLPTPMTSYSQRSPEEWRAGRPAGNGGTRQQIGDLQIVATTQLLPTPNATDGQGGIRAVPSARTHAGPDHGPRLRDVAPSLLPTPQAADSRRGAEQEMGGQRPSGAKRSDGLATALLKTPTAQLAVNGGSQHPDKRRAGGHGPTLADQVEHLLPTPDATHGRKTTRTSLLLPGAVEQLLPTPRATDGTKGGPGQRGSSGDLMLPSAVMELLPTPMAADSERESTTWPRGNATLKGALLPTPRVTARPGMSPSPSTMAGKHGQDLAPVIGSLLPGGPTSPLSADGKPSSGGLHPGQLSLDGLESA